MKRLLSSKTGRSWGVVDTPSAAAMLLDKETLRFFAPFLGRARTVSQAARHAHARVDTTMYRVERLLEAGLLTRVDVSGLRGRKRYKAVADRFVVPFDATRFETLVDLLLHHAAEHQRQFARGLVAAMAGDEGGWMLRVHRDDENDRESLTVDAAPQGQLDWQMTEMLAHDAPATWFTWQGLRLKQAHAKALQRELLSLWQRYDALSFGAETDEPYVKHMLQLHLTPIEE